MSNEGFTTAELSEIVNEQYKTISDLRAMLADAELLRASQAEKIEAQAERIAELETAMKTITIYVEKWNANKLGDVSLQRQRWQRLGEVAEKVQS